MPTGYTAAVEDGTVTTLEDFALRCSRAFGACITMRDDSSDKLPPESFEPNNSYHDEQITEANKTLVKLSKMSTKAAEKEAEKAFKESLKSFKDTSKRLVEQDNRYEAMLTKVTQWEPHKDITPLKEFMINQLQISISSYRPDAPVRKSGRTWFLSQEKEAKRDLEYHGAEINKEIKRTQDRNQWLANLRASL